MILNLTKKNLFRTKKILCGTKKGLLGFHTSFLLFSILISEWENMILNWTKKILYWTKKGLRGLRGFHTWFLLFTTLISDVWKKYQDRRINSLLAKIYKSTLLLSLFSSLRSSKSALCCIGKSSIKPNIFFRILVKMKKKIM